MYQQKAVVEEYEVESSEQAEALRQKINARRNQHRIVRVRTNGEGGYVVKVFFNPFRRGMK